MRSQSSVALFDVVGRFEEFNRLLKSMTANTMKWRVALAIVCLISPVSAWQILSANEATTLPRKHTAHRRRYDVALCMTARDDKIFDVDNDIEHFSEQDSADTDTRFYSSSSGISNNRIGGRRISALAEDAQSSSIVNAKTALSITAATILAVLLIDDITMRFETVQEWRYTWPSLGVVYVISGLSSVRRSESNIKKQQRNANSGVVEYGADRGMLKTLGGNIRSLSAYVPIPNDPILGGLAALAGVGVLVGGYIDAFFPVWYTSPDLLGTRAGIEADSAAILLIMTIYGVFSNIGRYNISSRNVEYASIMKDNENDNLSSIQFPSWAVAVILCSQLWEIASATFYSWGEMLGIVT